MRAHMAAIHEIYEGTYEVAVMKLTCVLLHFRHHACTLRAAMLHTLNTINSKGTIFYLELPIEGYN
jgi:hypothetical protein